jgi:ABC-type amino acid transport substrate-binding protein
MAEVRESGRPAPPRRRWRLALAPLAALATLFSAPHLCAADLPEIQTSGSLRVLVVLDAHRREFFALDVKMPGFDREIIEGFAQIRGLKVEVINLPSFDDLIPALLDHRGDIIAAGYRDSDTRRKSIAFTDEVFPNRFVVVTLKPHRVIHTMEELSKERVGATRGAATAEAVLAAGLPPASLDDSIPIGAYVEALHSGRVSAAVWSVERALPAQREDPTIQLGMYLGKPGSLAFGLRKEDTQLRAALNDHIGRVRRSGAWSRMVIKYFGENALTILQQATGPAIPARP